VTSDSTPRVDQALAHAQFLRAVARGVLGGDAEVEDVLQETFVVAWREGPEKPGSLRAWLATVARRLALDRRRAGARRERREHAAARPEGLPSPEEIAAREETRRRLVAAVLALEEPYRTMLLWRYYAAKTLAEIALLQDAPVDTVRTRLQRGLARLRERLDAQHHGDRRAWAVLLAPLAYGSATAAAATVVAAVAGGIAVKKVAVAAALLLLAVGGYVVATREGPSDTPTVGGVPAAPQEAAAAAAAMGDAGATLAATAAPERAAGFPSPTTTLPFRGRIVDAEGRPVAGASVLPRGLYHDAHEKRMPLELHPDSVTATTTDAEGRFSHDAEGPLGKTAITMLVRVDAQGFALLQATLPRETEARIVLGRGGRLSLLVSDEGGRAPVDAWAIVADAEREIPTRSWSEALVPEVTAATGGRLDVRLAPGRYRARVRAKGLRPVDTQVLVVEDGRTTEHRVRLDPGIVAEFRVVDEAGEPVGGAQVSTHGPLPFGETATTDADGRCRIAGIALPVEQHRGPTVPPDQRLHYAVSKQGFARSVGWRTLPPGPGPLAIEVRLAVGVVVRLRITDSAGAPVPDATAQWEVLPGHWGPLSGDGVATPVADGVWEMPRVRAGPHRIGAGTPSGDLFERVWKDVEVGPSDSEMTLVLARRDRALTGLVLRPDGSPATGGVTFDPEASAGFRSFSASATRIDAEGRFRLERLRPGRADLVVKVGDRPAQRFPVEIPAEGPIPDVTLRLRGGKPIAGRVVDRSGAAVAGIAVALWRQVDVVDHGVTRSHSVQDAETRADADGSFSFTAEEGSAFRIRVSGGWTQMQGGPATVRAGTEGLVVRVKPASEGHGMSLRVFATSAGAPYEGKLEIGWKVAGAPWIGTEMLADERGGRRFSVWGPPGTYDFSLYAPSHRVTVLTGVRMEETPEGTTVEVALDRGAVVRLRVRDGEGRAIADTWLTANGTPVKTDAAGECESGGWPPGSTPFAMNVALASDTEYTFARVAVPTTPASVDVTLRRRGIVRVRLGVAFATLGGDVVLRLVDARGTVVEEYTVEATRAARWNADTRIPLSATTDGPHRVVAEHGERRGEATVAVAIGRTVEASVVWK
jgi:RNA polymerase sigma-70 factor (ECF subfamily)